MDITTLGLSKQYTNNVAAGITAARVEGSSIILTLVDGSEAVCNLPTPKDGVSVIDLSIDKDGSLLCHLSDDSIIDAGLVPTVDPDLTNYYTKKEFEELLKQDGPQYNIYTAKDVYSSVTASPTIVSPTSIGGQNIINAVQKAYDNGDYKFRLRMWATDPSLIPQYVDTVLTLPENGNGTITETSIRKYIFSNLTSSTLKYYYFSKNIKMVNGKVEANTTTVGSIYYKEETIVNTTKLESLTLSKTNTTAYTPTKNYHPATKKYVDDAIAAIVNGDEVSY